MHYADGVPAKQGDLVIRREKYEHSMDAVGIIMSITPGSTTCNAQMIPLAVKQRTASSWLPPPGQNALTVTLSECQKIGDVPESQQAAA